MNTTQCFYFIEHYERLRDKLQDIISVVGTKQPAKARPKHKKPKPQ